MVTYFSRRMLHVYVKSHMCDVRILNIGYMYTVIFVTCSCKWPLLNRFLWYYIYWSYTLISPRNTEHLCMYLFCHRFFVPFGQLHVVLLNVYYEDNILKLIHYRWDLVVFAIDALFKTASKNWNWKTVESKKPFDMFLTLPWFGPQSVDVFIVSPRFVPGNYPRDIITNAGNCLRCHLIADQRQYGAQINTVNGGRHVLSLQSTRAGNCLGGGGCAVIAVVLIGDPLFALRAS